MKTAILLFHLSLISCIAFSAQNDGKISQIKPGSYRIQYPQQIIKVYFDRLPSGDIENVFAEIDLNENERYEIAKLIKEQIDQLPEAFINEYLDKEIYALNIQSSTVFGFNFDNQIMIDIRKIKQGMSFKNSVKSSLAHQMAYLFKDDPPTREASSRMRNYLYALHQTFDESDEKQAYSIYEKGYVSRYANGEISGDYSPQEEFAEMFAHLTCEDNRWDLMEFANSHPENVLSIKVQRYVDFLVENISGFNNDYFRPLYEDTSGVVSSYSTPTYKDVDGEVLLNIHELRSYQSLDFESMDNENENWTASNDNKMYEETPAKSWEEIEAEFEPEVEYQVYEYSEQKDEFQENQNQSYQKKKKKKKGTGLLITGAAIYVLLQLINAGN